MISMPQKDVIDVYNFLVDLSCCKRCILRFLGLYVTNNENPFQNPEEYIDKLIGMESDKENALKKFKSNTCPVCLNSFDKQTLEKLFEDYKINCEEYNYSNFFFNVSFPKCFSIRAHGMYLHLKKNFPDLPIKDIYDASGPTLEQPHKIFRCVVTDVLATILKKNCHPKSNFNLLLTLGYENDNEEVEAMKTIIGKKQNKRNRKDALEVSRNNIFELLKDISPEKFKTHFPVPPVIPEKDIFIENIEFTADPIYLGGRYLKFKRNVGQTPWVVDGVSISEHNIQEIIYDAICKVFRTQKNEMTFCASGREDVDVRMLGNGRPFYIKIDNPRDRNITKEQFSQIENDILQTGLAAVVKLQLTYASELNRIKLGEQEKQKTYRALCKTEAPDVPAAVEAINNQSGDLKIVQLTPMRVLHRRTLLARDKLIHKMEANIIPDQANLFEVEIITQAGTYIKEFVHGDFERTTPSISSIIGYPTDLVALDCVDINLMWPYDLHHR